MAQKTKQEIAEEFSQKLNQWEEWMRSGKGQKVRQELRVLNLSRVPRSQAHRVANFAHRLNLPNICLRLLNPFVRPKDKMVVVATDVEKAEYAVGLIRVGAHIEASQLLEEIDGVKIPMVMLYRGFGHITRWEYAKAITCLRKFISTKNVDAYQKLIAQVNLAAAYVEVNKLKTAKKLLDKILVKTKKQELSLLRGNAHELSAQVYIRSKDYKKAQKELDLAQGFLRSSKTIGRFFVKKWNVILRLKSHKNKKKALQDLQRLRSEAIKIKHWETVRDCDYYLFEQNQSSNLFLYLFFGTPYADFRRRLRGAQQIKKRIPRQFTWQPNLKVQKRKQTEHNFSLALGEDLTTEVRIKPGQLHHRLLMILSQDFYRTFGVGHLFGLIFPVEYYNPLSSPGRVHKAIQRFRLWAKENDLPVNIEEEAGQYRLKATGSWQMTLEAGKRVYSKEEIVKNRLQKVWPVNPFSSSEACKELGISRNSLSLAFQPLLRAGLIYSQGKGPRQRYTFSKGTLGRLMTTKII